MATAAPSTCGSEACVENARWSAPAAYDLTRTKKRASVPRDEATSVPRSAGVYAICAEGSEKGVGDLILDFGECGPRPSSGCGLRERLASTVDHSASENIAQDIRNGELSDPLYVVWAMAASKAEAKQAQDALICLFRREFGEQPRYNGRVEDSSCPDDYSALYENLKALVGSLNHRDSEREVTRLAMAASEPVLDAVWDNSDDAEYDAL